MKTILQLKRYLKGLGGYVFLSLLCAALAVSSKMAIPFLTGKALDQIREGNTEIYIYLLIIGAFIAVGTIFRYLFDLSTSYLGQRAMKKLRDDLYIAINDVPLSYIDTHPHGDLLLRLTNDIENVQTGLIRGATAIYEGVVQIIITLVFMFTLHWFLALVVVLLSPLSILLSKYISTHNSKYFKSQNRELGGITGYTLESITNLEAIQSYGLEGQRIAEFERRNSTVRIASFKALFAASYINPSTRLVNNTIYAAVILLGASLIFVPDTFAWTGVAFTVGGLSSFLSYSHQYTVPFNSVADAMTELLYAAASLDRILETIDYKKDIDEGNIELHGSIETLEAKDLVFSYDGKRTIIDHFSLDIYKGHKIALVGTTGCGKTTIINLLMRFYDAQEGHFEMNGISTLDVKKKQMRSHVGMVLQDTWLQRATIAENIAFGKKDATMEEIVAAAKKAHADEFIRRLEHGYDTVVSNATGLSMGEKQLLCVARIILVEPEIVLLDEATSNIDLRTELALADAFDELMRGKTSIVVAHRLSTIKNADLILVMHKGRVMEQGNFAELMQKNGFFAELYNSQLV